LVYQIPSMHGTYYICVSNYTQAIVLYVFSCRWVFYREMDIWLRKLRPDPLCRDIYVQYTQHICRLYILRYMYIIITSGVSPQDLRPCNTTIIKIIDRRLQPSFLCKQNRLLCLRFISIFTKFNSWYNDNITSYYSTVTYYNIFWRNNFTICSLYCARQHFWLSIYILTCST